MVEPKKVKYKIKLLHEGASELEASADGGTWECAHPSEVAKLITAKFNEGWVFYNKRPAGDWGWELFFRKKR